MNVGNGGKTRLETPGMEEVNPVDVRAYFVNPVGKQFMRLCKHCFLHKFVLDSLDEDGAD